MFIMKSHWLYLLVVAITACNSSTESTAKDEQQRTDSSTGPVAESSVNPMQLAPVDLPTTFKFKGKVQDAWQWTDLSGDNIFFTSVVAPYNDNDKGEHEEEEQSAELYAFHYVKKEGAYQLAWEMKDGEMSCPLDIVTEFIKGAATVTDLDKDGIAETKVQYALACRGDVSPSTMRIILQENKSVYTLQGNRWLNYGPDSKFDVSAANVNLEKLPPTGIGDEDLARTFGRYESERSFAGAPPVFLEYARNEWLKYVIEK